MPPHTGPMVLTGTVKVSAHVTDGVSGPGADLWGLWTQVSPLTPAAPSFSPTKPGPDDVLVTPIFEMPLVDHDTEFTFRLTGYSQLLPGISNALGTNSAAVVMNSADVKFILYAVHVPGNGAGG